MNWDELMGNWNQVKGELKEQWSRLTDDDLEMIEGEEDKLIGRLQKRYGILKDEAEMELNDFLNHAHEEKAPV